MDIPDIGLPTDRDLILHSLQRCGPAEALVVILHPKGLLTRGDERVFIRGEQEQQYRELTVPVKNASISAAVVSQVDPCMFVQAWSWLSDRSGLDPASLFRVALPSGELSELPRAWLDREEALEDIWVSGLLGVSARPETLDVVVAVTSPTEDGYEARYFLAEYSVQDGEVVLGRGLPGIQA